MSLDAKSVGARIRNLRVEKGLSQTALGKKIAVAGSIISLWECGKVRPSLRSRAKLAKFFRVGIEFLSGDGGQTLAEVRDMALSHSKKKLQTGNASAADVNAANNAVRSAATDGGKGANAREEDLRERMNDAREEFLGKLARFESDEGRSVRDEP